MKLKKNIYDLFSKNHFQIKLFFFSVLIILILYRSPYILLNGRFAAEEGSFWFRNSYINGPIYGFFQVFWSSGYFNLWANITSIIATIPKLEYAPLVTVYFSLFLKLYIIFYIINTESEFLTNLFYKILTSFIIIVSPPIVPEIWLNTINSQTFFGILTVLIFFEKYNEKKFINRISPYILLISGLSTLYTCVLSPFYYLKYRSTKKKSDLKNFIFITFATSIQFIIFAYTKFGGIQHDLRFNSSLEKVINYCYNVIVKSIFGREISQNIIEKLSQFNSTLLLIIFLLLVFAIVISIKFLIKGQKDRVLFYLILFFITESLFVYMGSWGQQVQGRYAVVPGIIILFIILRLSLNSIKIIKITSIFIIFLSLFAGLYEYKYNTKYPQFLICMECPHWKEEIDVWRKNPNYNIKIWNYPEKSMYLN